MLGSEMSSSSEENWQERASGILGTGLVSGRKIELLKKQGPACLTGVEVIGSLDVSQVIMVSPDNEGLFSPLEPVSPFLQG